MKQQIEHRLQQLQTEYEAGQKMLFKHQAKEANLRKTLLRISKMIRSIVIMASLLLALAGCVKRTATQPPAGVPTGETTNVTVAPMEVCVIPDVVGHDASILSDVLGGAGLSLIKEFQSSDSIPAGLILAQRPPAGTKFDGCHGELTIVVSLGKPSQANEAEGVGSSQGTQDKTYDVVLHDMGLYPAQVFKAVHDEIGLSWSDFNKKVRYLPGVLVQGVTSDIAEDLQAKLSAQGASVSLEAPGYAPAEQPGKDCCASFLLAIEDVFSVEDQTIVTGLVERGVLYPGDQVEIVGLSESAPKVVAASLELLHRTFSLAQPGDNIGVVLENLDGTSVDPNEVEGGMVLARPGSIKAHRKFTASVYILSEQDGGSQKSLFDEYRPQFYIRTMDVTGTVHIPSGSSVDPGDAAILGVDLIVPVTLERGTRFAIREGGKTVGFGWVIDVSD